MVILSRRVMRTLKRFNSEIEVYSIDEAFLDLSNFSDEEVENVGKEIRSNCIYSGQVYQQVLVSQKQKL